MLYTLCCKGGRDSNAHRSTKPHLQEKTITRASTPTGHPAGKSARPLAPSHSPHCFSSKAPRRVVPDCHCRCPRHPVSNVNALESVRAIAAARGARRVRVMSHRILPPSIPPLSCRGAAVAQIRPSLVPPPPRGEAVSIVSIVPLTRPFPPSLYLLGYSQ